MVIISDFDGTISSRDTLNELCSRHAPETSARLSGALLSGELSLREVIHQELASVSVLREQLVEAAIREVPLRPGFDRFLAHVRQHGHRLVVVSAGFRQLIEPMLQAAGHTEVEVIANDLVFGDGTVRAVFREVPICGSCEQHCKRSEVERLRGAADDTVVYIGDGFSDRCGAEAADVVFARDGLAEWLDQRRVPYLPFDDFHDVLAGLDTTATGSARSARDAN